ncbi:MAG: lysine-2,3-aminomutase-like protein [Alphaproteobacteria bacterium]
MTRRPDSRSTLRAIPDLVAVGLVPAARAAALEKVAARYQVALTPHLAGLIDPDDPNDPIARQYLPDPAELRRSPIERADPIGDEPHSPVKGIVHRYPDRVLLKPVMVCPVYCRFCFRREMLGNDGALGDAELDAALAYIRAHEEVWEVILTGGDPLILSPRRLRAIIQALQAIPHVQVVRIHSRVPVADPSRITPALLRALDAEKALYLAIHCNHPRELNEAARDACLKLARAGIPLLGQSVLLKGVNDDAATLEALFRAMVAARVKPYYLHHADLAPGTAHFRTSIEAGRRLVRKLRGRLSGLAQPTYVLDIPDGHGKVPIGPEYLSFGPDGNAALTDPWGKQHAYPAPSKRRVARREPC